MALICGVLTMLNLPRVCAWLGMDGPHMQGGRRLEMGKSKVRGWFVNILGGDSELADIQLKISILCFLLHALCRWVCGNTLM